MAIKYYKLFDLLNRRGMKKGDLLEIISYPTIQKLWKGEIIKTSIINDICEFLDCQPGDIMEYIPDKNTFEMLADQQKDIDEAETTKDAIKAIGKNIAKAWKK